MTSTLASERMPLTESANLTSLQSYLVAEEKLHPSATGTFTMILSAIGLAGKFIAARNRRARIEHVLGSMGEENVQGEIQQ